MIGDEQEGAGDQPGPAQAKDRARLRLLAEYGGDAHLLTDGQGVVIEGNHAATSMLNCPEALLPGKPLGLFVARGYRSRFYESLARLHSGSRNDEFETRIASRGERRNVLMRAEISEPDESGESRFHWILSDLNAAHRAQEDRIHLIRRLISAHEDERRRIARELHDGLGQELTVLSLTLRSLSSAISGELDDQRLLRAVEESVSRLSRDMHSLAVELRPTALDDLGLDPALSTYIGHWSERTGIAADYCPSGLDRERMPPEIETATYRIVQEALNNAARHSGASLVTVTAERSDRELVVLIEDDGRGFDSGILVRDPARPRLGLVGMRERVELIGGTLQIDSGVGAGTLIQACIPLNRPEGGS